MPSVKHRSQNTWSSDISFHLCWSFETVIGFWAAARDKGVRRFLETSIPDYNEYVFSVRRSTGLSAAWVLRSGSRILSKIRYY